MVVDVRPVGPWYGCRNQELVTWWPCYLARSLTGGINFPGTSGRPLLCKDSRLPSARSSWTRDWRVLPDLCGRSSWYVNRVNNYKVYPRKSCDVFLLTYCCTLNFFYQLADFRRGISFTFVNTVLAVGLLTCGHSNWDIVMIICANGIYYIKFSISVDSRPHFMILYSKEPPAMG